MTQNPFANPFPGVSDDRLPSLMREVSAARRFTVEQLDGCFVEGQQRATVRYLFALMPAGTTRAQMATQLVRQLGGEGANIDYFGALRLAQGNPVEATAEQLRDLGVLLRQGLSAAAAAKAVGMPARSAQRVAAWMDVDTWRDDLLMDDAVQCVEAGVSPAEFGTRYGKSEWWARQHYAKARRVLAELAA